MANYLSSHTGAQIDAFDTAIQGKVAKAGDTMSGNLTISTNDNPNIKLKNANMDITAGSLSASEYSSLYFKDKNDNNIAFIQSAQVASDGHSYLQIAARTQDSSSNVLSNYFTLHSYKDGTRSVVISHPAAWRSALGAVNKAGDTMTGLLNINTNGNTLTIGSQNSGYCHFKNSASIPFYFNQHLSVDGNIYIYDNGPHSLQRGGISSGWVNGRDNVLLRQTSINGYSPCISIKTLNGSWEIGAYNNTSYQNSLIFSYVTDTNYNSNNNTSVVARITSAGAFTNSSKRALKENILDFKKSATDIINSVKICSFNMKGDPEKDYRVGFIADDTDPILSGKNQDIMDLQNCIGVMMKAIQELSSEIETLKQKLNS